MYTNSTLKPIQDNELYIGLDGTQWANTDKATIPELHKVTETKRPDDNLFFINGFTINDKYEQVWNYTAKNKDEIIGSTEYNLKHYAELRAREYPPQSDYLDAKVKQSSESDEIRAEGLLQEKSYFEKCLAVKLKYPKE